MNRSKGVVENFCHIAEFEYNKIANIDNLVTLSNLFMQELEENLFEIDLTKMIKFLEKYDIYLNEEDRFVYVKGGK